MLRNGPFVFLRWLLFSSISEVAEVAFYLYLLPRRFVAIRPQDALVSNSNFPQRFASIALTTS